MSGNQQNIDALGKILEDWRLAVLNTPPGQEPPTAAEHLAQAGVLDPSVVSDDQAAEHWNDVPPMIIKAKLGDHYRTGMTAWARGDV